MIEACIRTKRDKIVSYEISGHAESGEYGHDVVCAAVSVLSITTANNIYEMARIKPVTQMEDGYLYVEIPLSIPEKQGVLAQTLLEAFSNSMKAVEKSYGQYITLKFENGGQ